MLELLYFLFGVGIGFVSGMIVFGKRNDPPPLVQMEAAARRAGVTPRCGIVSYIYSDGSVKTFHNCEGYADFSLAFGRAQAPEGATLVRRQGGTHR